MFEIDFEPIIAAAYPAAHLLCAGDERRTRELLVLACLAMPDADRVQRKRRRYPTEPSERRRLLLEKSQLFYLQVLARAEYFERQQERGPEPIGQAGWMVRYLRLLVHASLLRNSFWASVAAARVLEGYGTRETLDMHALVAASGETKDAAQCRRAKKQILDTILERFAGRVRIAAGPRGERVLRAEPWPRRWRPFLETRLELLAPASRCCFAVADGPSQQRLAEEDPELLGVHAFWHPPCLSHLAGLVGAAPPGRSTSVPLFERGARDRSGGSGGPSGDSLRPPPMLDSRFFSELRADVRSLARRRKSLQPDRLGVWIDGTLRATLKLDHSGSVRRAVELAVEKTSRSLEFAALPRDCSQSPLPMIACPLLRRADGELIGVDGLELGPALRGWSLCLRGRALPTADVEMLLIELRGPCWTPGVRNFFAARSWPRWVFAASMLTLLVVAGLRFREHLSSVPVLGSSVREVMTPEVNVPVVQLRPGTRSRPEPVILHGEAERFLLVLSFYEPQPFADYEISLLGGDEVLWSRRGLRKSEYGNHIVLLPRRLVPATGLELRLFGIEGQLRSELALYHLDLEEPGR